MHTETAPHFTSALGAALAKTLATGEVKVQSRLNQINESDASEKNGWVTVQPMTDRDRSPRVVGLLVAGIDLEGELRARTLVVARDSPDWFHTEVMAACKSGSNKAFRVWVNNRHPNGHTAFVKPQAKSLNQANAEWARRQTLLEGKPMNYSECCNESELMEFFYRRFCLNRNWFFHSWDATKGEALAVTPHSKIQKLTGAPAATAHFADLTTGRMSMTTALERFGQAERVFRL
jgi:hypothetical protein